MRRRRTSEHDRPLQRPAPAAHQRARRRVRAADRHHTSTCGRTTASCWPTRSCRRAARSPADVYLTENSPELMNLEAARRCSPRCPRASLGQMPARARSPAGQVGRHGPAGEQPRLRPGAGRGVRSCRRRSSTWRSRSGRARIAIAPTDSDFPPLVGAVIATHGESAATAWLAGLKRNAHVYQDEEAVVAAVNRGDVATGIINQYYWYRLRLELGAARDRTARSTTSRTTTSARSRTSPARRCSRRASTGRGASGSSSSWSAPPASGSSPAATTSSTRPARDRAEPALCRRSRSISPATLSPAALGTDHTAVQLIEQAGLA